MFRASGSLSAALVAAVVAAMWASAPRTTPDLARPTSAGAAANGVSASELRPLPFFYDLYTFRGEDGHSTVVASFAVRAGELQREEADDQVQYRFDVTLVLADTAVRSVKRTDDSVFVRVPRAFSGRHLLHTQVEVDAPPSSSIRQRVIMSDATEPGIGQLFGSSFTIPDYTGSELMLSDVALGLPDAVAGWQRRGYTLALLPTSQFPGSSFDVYYELYNLPRGHGYSTDISIQDLDEFGRPLGEEGRTVNTRFTGESTAHADDSLEELRRVEASLDEGRYRLTVTVTDESNGQTVRRSRDFHVRGWERASTMVLARPASRIRPSNDY